MRAVRREKLVGSQPWLRAALRCGAILAMAALALPLAAQGAYAATPSPSASPSAPVAAPTVAPGADPLADAKATLGPLLDRIHQLYQNAEAATEQYNATAGKLAGQQTELASVNARIGQQQALVDGGLDVAAQLASAQYRNGNLSAYGQLLLAKDPYQALDMGQLLAAAGARRPPSSTS